jgi:hypothetical protein
MRAGSRFILGAALLLCVALPSFGQQTDPTVDLLHSSNGQVQSGLLSRWFDMQSGIVGIRNKSFVPYSTKGGPWISQIHYSASFSWSFKFDPKGNYKLNFAAGTGKGFVGSWNNTGVGHDAFVRKFFLRQLSLAAMPLPGLELQYGGFGTVRGDWTDITDLNNNGFLMGERIRIRRPDKFFFDEISLTGGALTDIDNPDVFDRFRRLDKLNYYQCFVVKRIGENVSLSGGYDSYYGDDLLHQAVEITIKNLPVADSILFENYERLNNLPAWGFGLTFQKTLFSRWLLSAGVSSVERYFVPLNSERLGRGHKIYFLSRYPIWRELSFVVSGTKAFNIDFPLAFGERFDVSFTYDVQKALKHAHLF